MKNALFLFLVGVSALISQIQQRIIPLMESVCNVRKMPVFQFSPREKNFVTGSEFAHLVMNWKVEKRDSIVLKEIVQGNIPNSFRQFVYLTDSLKDTDGKMHEVTLCVLPDFLAIGTDSDFLRIPMLPQTAQKIADYYGAILPTRKLSDLIHSHSDLKLSPHPMTPDVTMTTIPVFVRHDSIIEVARRSSNKPLNNLIAGHKKDIVITNRMTDESDRLFIYGWHHLDGKPIQPLSAAHDIYYVDYSHGVRLICDAVLVDGEIRSIKELLHHSVLYRLFSDEDCPMIMTQY